MVKWGIRKISRVVVAGILALLLVVGGVAVFATPSLPPGEEVAAPAVESAEGQGPDYDVVPLEYEEIAVAAVQMKRVPVDPKHPKLGIQANLEHMLELCDRASGGFACALWDQGRYTKRKNLIVFPEFTLTGFGRNWTREDWQRVAIEVPGGPEAEAIGEKAKELNAYIVFASHTKDKDWPDHFFNTSIIIDPNGEVIHKHWKAYFLYPGLVEYSTTVHEVLDDFVARYGWDAVWPVARTPIGNIATYVCSESFAPEPARMFAFKGAEILCLCISGGGREYRLESLMDNFRSHCIASGVYGIFANVPDGGSMIVDPDGKILAQASDAEERIVSYIIPIASFRAVHKRPYIRTELYAPVLEENPGKYPPNMYSDHGVPENILEAMLLAFEHARW